MRAFSQCANVVSNRAKVWTLTGTLRRLHKHSHGVAGNGR